MTGWIIFIVISIIVLVVLMYLSSQYNKSRWLFWAMVLLITVSVFSGRWHRHYMPHWNQVKFEHVMNEASSANDSLKTQVTEYNHHDNGTVGFFSWKHKVQSQPNLASAQDDALHSADNLMKFPIKSTSNYQADFKARRSVAKNTLKQLQRHKYVGQGPKADHVISNK